MKDYAVDYGTASRTLKDRTGHLFEKVETYDELRVSLRREEHRKKYVKTTINMSVAKPESNELKKVISNMEKLTNKVQDLTKNLSSKLYLSDHTGTYQGKPLIHHCHGHFICIENGHFTIVFSHCSS